MNLGGLGPAQLPELAKRAKGTASIVARAAVRDGLHGFQKWVFDSFEAAPEDGARLHQGQGPAL